MTVEHDDRQPRDEARPTALAGTASSQEEAADLFELLWLNWDAAAADHSELTDWTLLCWSALVEKCSVSVSSSASEFVLVLLLCLCVAEGLLVDFS